MGTTDRTPRLLREAQLEKVRAAAALLRATDRTLVDAVKVADLRETVFVLTELRAGPPVVPIDPEPPTDPLPEVEDAQ